MITLLYPYNFTQVAALLIPRINSKLFVDNVENALIRIPLHRVVGAVPSLPRRSAMMVTWRTQTDDGEVVGQAAKIPLGYLAHLDGILF